MFCSNCGRLLEDGEKYCPICGTLNEEPAAAASGVASEGVAPSDGGMRSEMAGQALKWGIISLAFSLSGCLSLLGFIFSFTAKRRVNEYISVFGGPDGRARVGHILGRVGFGLGLGYSIFFTVYFAIIILAIAASAGGIM